MTVRKLTLTFAILMTAVLATGCCEQEKAQISALTSQNETLMADNKNFRNQIADLETKLGEMKQQVVAKDAQIEDMKIKLAAKPEEKIIEKTDTVIVEGWESTTIGDKVTVGSDVLFSPGRATLTNTGKRALGTIVQALRGTYSGLPVRVYGYTDSDPIEKSKKFWTDNLDLSANRAMAVTRYLRENGISKENIETIAMGMTHPVASNKTKAGKAQNRRVEIFVIKSK